MSKTISRQDWQFLTEDVEAILEGLRQAEFDHIYPANPTLLDRFLVYLGEAGVRETRDQFPDPRQRRSIPVRFLTQTLLVRPLFAVSSLAQLGPVLSTNSAVLHLLGFNAHQIEHGFRANAQRRPFGEEILADFAARIEPAHCLEHTKAVLGKLIAFHPELFAQATLLMDCKAVYAPAGKATRTGQLPAVALKVCVVSLWLEGKALPIAWPFGRGHKADQVLGKAMLEEVLPLLVEAGAQELVMDAGFLDGEWLRALHQRHGLAILLRVRENMDLFADALGQTRGRPVLPGETVPQWTEAPLPDIKKSRRPISRRVLLCSQLESWQSLGMPADALVVEDRLADGEIRHFVVARTWVHFAFLAYTLLFLFGRWAKDHPGELAATRELLVIRGGNYGLIGPGDFADILLDHHDVWQSKRSEVMAKLNYRRPP